MKRYISCYHPSLFSFLYLVDYDSLKVLFEQSFSTFQLFGSILLYFFQFVFPSHGFVLMHTQAMIGEYFHPLYTFIFSEMFTQTADVFFKITVSRN